MLFCAGILASPGLLQAQINHVPQAEGWRAAANTLSNNGKTPAISNANTQITTKVQFYKPKEWITIQPPDEQHNKLHIGSPYVTNVEIFDAINGKLLYTNANRKVTDGVMQYHPQFLLDLQQLQPNWQHALVARITAKSGKHVSVKLVDANTAQTQTAQIFIGAGIHYGALGLMALLSLCLAVFSRDAHAARLAVTLSIWVGTMLIISGYGALYFWPNQLSLIYSLVNPAIAWASIASAWFSFHFLAATQIKNIFLHGVRWNMWASGLYLFTAPILPENHGVAAVLLPMCGLFVVLGSITAMLRGDNAAKYLVAAAALTTLPFAVVPFYPSLHSLISIAGIGSVVCVVVAVIQRHGERVRQQELQVEINAERARFLASMSHEMRTPLNAIIGFSELANQERLHGHLADYVGHIGRSSAMLLNIVNDVLDYSKLEANGLEMHEEPVQLEALLNNVILPMEPSAAANRVELTTQIDPNLPKYILTDPTRCAQVLINLCSNAVKFTKDGSVTIRVSQEAKWLNFAVTDTGIGIDAQGIDKLFKPFQQASAKTAQQYGGTGLGLTISQQLAQLLGGRLQVSSEAGVGSTFSLLIPLHPAAAPNEIDAPKEVDQQALKGLNILLAEDNPVNRQLATRVLEKNGMHVLSAEDGAWAVEHASSHSIDLILMDMQMPKLTGIEATEKIRSLGLNTPILAMTASTEDEQRDACLNAGMNDFLSKPISQKLLLEKIEFWVTEQNQIPQINAIENTPVQHSAA